MRERERLALLEFRKEQAAIEETERVERERPIREAEKQLTRTTRELFEMERANVLSLPDSNFKIPSSIAGKSLNSEEARRFNADESYKFLRDTPDYYPCDANFDAITAYLTRNGVVIADAATFRIAYERLRDLGLLEDRPIPQPELEIATVPARIEPESEPQMFDGFDIQTGEAKQYTSREVYEMDSQTYRRAFRLIGEASPRFVHPNI